MNNKEYLETLLICGKIGKLNEGDYKVISECNISIRNIFRSCKDYMQEKEIISLISYIIIYSISDYVIDESFKEIQNLVETCKKYMRSLKLKQVLFDIYTNLKQYNEIDSRGMHNLIKDYRIRELFLDSIYNQIINGVVHRLSRDNVGEYITYFKDDDNTKYSLIIDYDGKLLSFGDELKDGEDVNNILNKLYKDKINYVIFFSNKSNTIKSRIRYKMR